MHPTETKDSLASSTSPSRSPLDHTTPSLTNNPPKRTYWEMEASGTAQDQILRTSLQRLAPPTSKRACLQANNLSHARRFSQAAHSSQSQSERQNRHSLDNPLSWKTKEVAPRIFTNAGNIALFLNPTISSSQHSSFGFDGIELHSSESRIQVVNSKLHTASTSRSLFPADWQGHSPSTDFPGRSQGLSPLKRRLPWNQPASSAESYYIADGQHHGASSSHPVLRRVAQDHQIAVASPVSQHSGSTGTNLIIEKDAQPTYDPQKSGLLGERTDLRHLAVTTALPRVPRLDLKAIHNAHRKPILSRMPPELPAPSTTLNKIPKRKSIASKRRPSIIPDKRRSSLGEGAVSRRLSNVDLGRLQQIGLEALLLRLVENRGFSKDTVLKVWERTRDLEMADRMLGRMSQAAISEARLNLVDPSQ